MPPAAVNMIFGPANCKLDNKMLGHLAQMCNADRPVTPTTMISDFAFNEVCVCDEEAAYFKDLCESLRRDEIGQFVAEIVNRMAAEAAASKNVKLAQLAASIQEEYARLCKVFFLRIRCIEVSRVSTHETIGRIVSFPDQISDDYGNNLEPRGEKGMNPAKVSGGERGKDYKGRTLYLGYGQGATMAQISACLQDEQCIIFDGTILSHILTKSFFAGEVPKTAKMVERSKEERDWHILYESLEIVAKRYAGVMPAAMEIVEQAAEAEAARRAEAADRKAAAAKEKEKAKAAKSRAPPKPAAANKGKEGAAEKPSPAEQAESYFAKRKAYKITAIVPEGPTTRFEKNGKFPSSALSNVLGDYMTIVVDGAYPYEAPPKQE